MNIKHYFLLLFLFFGVSFSASASTLITATHTTNLKVPCITFGTTGTWGYWNDVCVGTTFENSGTKTITRISGRNGQFSICWGAGGLCAGTVFYRESSSCPSGSEFDSSSGACVIPPPSCEGDDIFNPDTGLCEDIPFCDRQSTIDQIIEADNACHAQGGTFVSQCNNGNDLIEPSLDLKCVMSDSCVVGGANWPECLSDLDPSKPIDPPTGGFNPDAPDTSNPKPPSFDKPEPDEVTPQETTDTAVLTALQNLNRDHNAAATALNKDLNDGIADLTTELDGINKTTHAVGETIDSQIKQDYEIYLAQKALSLSQIGAINNIGSDITSAIDGSSKDIVNAIDKLGEKEKGSVTAVGCASFECDGDAATCYLAKSSWLNECGTRDALTRYEDSLSILHDDLKGISQSSVNADGAFKGVYAESKTSADDALDAYTTANGFSFDGGCPAARTYHVLGQPWVIDFQPFCDLALVFRFFIMASASVASFLMIAKHL
ncbi:virulence factor TspB C-terminal domain-related protein [Vibrio scophthalmi]|uniref:Uncharacterized protein n=1 Tax=Vibrio scophthalmi LMG 19158 TaxID=870967 RepID=F9RSE5_9VIBR|nr:virulence factor TspB C-terminal domain-related protein [Vibrio scophthalmi]EGU32395.1 hypothetical protein VIS19158_15144 [Vibrio scophthalmi LMG 19158]